MDRGRNHGDRFSEGILSQVRYVPEQLAAAGPGHLSETARMEDGGLRMAKLRKAGYPPSSILHSRLKEILPLPRSFFEPSAKIVAPRLLGHLLIRNTPLGPCGGPI